MQAGLSLRVSQHLALTPQLQQSIRLLQLSTLEMEQEVEHMLGDNPFLERDEADSSNDSTSNDSAQPPTSAPDSAATLQPGRLAQGPDEKFGFSGRVVGAGFIVMWSILTDGRLPLGGGVPRMGLRPRGRGRQGEGL